MMPSKTLNLAAALALAAGMAGTGLPAQAQSNPCAPANPCAPGAGGGQNAATDSGAQAGGGYAAAFPQTLHGPAARPFDVTADWQQAPFGDAMPAIVENYLRAAPYIGTGGRIESDAYGKLKELGFKTVVSLVTYDEEAEEVSEKGSAAGLEVVNIPVSTRAPNPAQVGKFARVAENPANYPILVHCHSANRVGAMWALYRAASGVPAPLAVQEGRTVGLKPSREGAVRKQLGLPKLATN